MVFTICTYMHIIGAWCTCMMLDSEGVDIVRKYRAPSLGPQIPGWPSPPAGDRTHDVSTKSRTLNHYVVLSVLHLLFRWSEKCVTWTPTLLIFFQAECWMQCRYLKSFWLSRSTSNSSTGINSTRMHYHKLRDLYVAYRYGWHNAHIIKIAVKCLISIGIQLIKSNFNATHAKCKSWNFHNKNVLMTPFRTVVLVPSMCLHPMSILQS